MQVMLNIQNPIIVKGDLNFFVVRTVPSTQRKEVVAGFQWINQAKDYVKERVYPSRYDIFTSDGHLATTTANHPSDEIPFHA